MEQHAFSRVSAISASCASFLHTFFWQDRKKYAAGGTVAVSPQEWHCGAIAEAFRAFGAACARRARKRRRLWGNKRLLRISAHKFPSLYTQIMRMQNRLCAFLLFFSTRFFISGPKTEHYSQKRRNPFFQWKSLRICDTMLCGECWLLSHSLYIILERGLKRWQN